MQLALVQPVADEIDRALDDLADVGLGEVVDALAALDPREVEHVVDQARQPLALAPDDLGVLGRCLAVGAAVREHLAEHRMIDSGVFSSWETFAMKSLFMREARRSALTARATMPRPTAMVAVRSGAAAPPGWRSISASRAARLVAASGKVARRRASFRSDASY